MNKLIVLNHKMNLDYDEIDSYIKNLNEIDTKNNIIILPSNIYLEKFINYSNWGIGAQNVHYKINGNYTGEISITQLKSIGVEYTMIGHYERRKYFHETNQIINKKLNAVIDANIIPILCFGSKGKIEEIKAELDELLVNIENINFIIFAYEPLEKKIEESLDIIKEQVKEIYQYLSETYKVKPNILYGGGVAGKNINDLLNCEYLNGILIGKISTNLEKIEKIIKRIN